jgi:hypothetical protein
MFSAPPISLTEVWIAETNFHHSSRAAPRGSSLSAGLHALVAAGLGDPGTALRRLR